MKTSKIIEMARSHLKIGNSIAYMQLMEGARRAAPSARTEQAIVKAMTEDGVKFN